MNPAYLQILETYVKRRAEVDNDPSAQFLMCYIEEAKKQLPKQEIEEPVSKQRIDLGRMAITTLANGITHLHNEYEDDVEIALKEGIDLVARMISVK